MSKYYAILKNDLVENIIFADTNFDPSLIDGTIVELSEARPNIGDSYCSKTKKFISNKDDFFDLSADWSQDLDHIYKQHPKKSEFDPVRIGTWKVRLKDGHLNIGCRKYPAKGICAILHKMLFHNLNEVSEVRSEGEWISHGKHKFKRDEILNLFNQLIGVDLK